ncbi:type II toxin-antitoxin system RelB/DinJ family antitoxin [Lactiplantibacillus modestisalitolerans]|uniref:Type II toxin-antitoxin system RelB/DinJ family antitoxin n=2 Tax=Lactiplantibacillus modestisalitolerans TaxID=1457219 RepID=A0ABV5WR31_9LACO
MIAMNSAKQQCSSIVVEIERTDQIKATTIFKSLGLDLPAAINLFIRQSIIEGGLPFEIKDDFESVANQAELQRRFEKAANHQGVRSHQLLDDKD